MAAVMANHAAEGIPISAGIGNGVAMGITESTRGGFYTMASMTVYVAPPRNPASFDGRALLLLPDMTGVSNRQNQELAGKCYPPPLFFRATLQRAPC